MKPFYRFAAAALLLVPCAVRGDIRSELPYHWLSIANHSGTFSTTTLQNCDLGKTQLLVNDKGSGVIKTDSPHGLALSTTGLGPYGNSRFDLPDGDWSAHFRARMADLDNGCVLSIGTGASGTTVSLQLYTRTDVGLRLCQVSNKAIDHYVDINAAGLCDALHDYALVYHQSAAKVDLYIDGELAGTLADFTAKVGPEGYQWFAPHGGLSTAYSGGIGIYLEEFRFYQRALTVEELATLDNLLVYNAGTSFTQAFTLATDEHIYLRTLGTTYAADAAVFTTGGLTIKGEQDITRRVTIDGGTVKLSTDGKKLLFVPNADPYKAVWKGGGTAGDWRDPANWTCYTASGTVISPSVIPTDKTTVVLTGNTSFTMPADETPFWKATELQGTVTLTGDCRWDGAELYSSKATVDCGGHKLTIANFTGIGSATIQNGEFTLEPSAGMIGENNLVTTAATVSKIHKDGAGILVLRKTTNVKAFALDGGLLRLQGATGIADGGTLTMAANTSFDTGGTIETKYGVFLNEGASILNTGGATGSTKAQLTGGLTLAEGATVYVANQNEISSTGAQYANYPIALNGGTIVKRGAGKWGVLNATISGAGTIRVEEGEFNIGNKGITIAPDVVLEVVSGAGAYIWSQGDNLTVPTILGDGKVRGNTYYYTVTNRFSGLLTVEGKGTKFADGMTLDLTKNTSACVLSSSVTFAGTSYTLDLSGRNVTPGEKLVTWSAAPSGVTFAWDSETAKKGVEPVITDEGIYYGAYVETAVWTGRAGTYDATNPRNWQCSDFSGKTISGAIPGDQSTLVVNVALSRDADWSALGPVAFSGDTRINLQGQSFTIAGFRTKEGVESGATVDNNATETGDLVINVAEGETTENTMVAIAGNTRLVKKGAGTFVNNRQQTYTGGTRVSEGVLKLPPVSSAIYYLGAIDSSITVEEGATFNMNGVYGLHVYNSIILAGGTLRNERVGQTSYGTGGLGNITLTADSRFELAAHVLFYQSKGVTIDMGGHRLDVTGSGSLISINQPAVITNGVFSIGSGVRFNPRQANINMTGASVVMRGTWENHGIVYTVKDLDITTVANVSRIDVTDTFRSANSTFGPVRLLKDATLDLAENTGTLAAASKLTFVDEAAITVNLAGRTTLSPGLQIVSWPSASPPADSVTFTPKGAFYYLVRKADGLYVDRGVMTIFR